MQGCQHGERVPPVIQTQKERGGGEREGGRKGGREGLRGREGGGERERERERERGGGRQRQSEVRRRGSVPSDLDEVNARGQLYALPH